MFNVLGHSSGPVLDDEPGMVQRHDLAKPFLLLVQCIQKFEIFTASHAVAPVRCRPEIDLPLDAVDDERGDGFLQLAVVVEIVVHLVPLFIASGETERAHRVDVEFTVERDRAAERIHHFIDKDRGGLMGGINGDVDAADILHAFGVREWHPGHARPEPARIDAQDQVTQIVVRVEPAVKLRCDIADGVGIVAAEGIHEGDPVRQQDGVQIKVVVEGEDLVGKSHHGL